MATEEGGRRPPGVGYDMPTPGGTRTQGGTPGTPSEPSTLTLQKVQADFNEIVPPASKIYDAKALAKQGQLIKNLDEITKGLEKKRTEADNKNTENLAKEKEIAKKELEAINKRTLVEATIEAGRKAFEETIKDLDEEKANEKREYYNRIQEEKIKVAEEELEELKKKKKELEDEKIQNDRELATIAEQEKLTTKFQEEAKKVHETAQKERKKYFEDIAGKNIGFFSLFQGATNKVLGALAAEDKSASAKSGFERVINENLRRAMIDKGKDDKEKENMNEIVKATISKMYNIERMSEEEFIAEFMEEGKDLGATEEQAKELFKKKQTMVRKNKFLGDPTKGFDGIAGGQAGKIVGAKSGEEVGGVLKDVVSMFLGPVGKIFLEGVTAIFNRMNAIGKEGKELYEKTGGRYGYGEGFDMAQAKGFVKFSGAARSMAFEYAKSADDVKKVFAEMNEYVGVKSFDQMEALARSTMQVANATGLATGEVAKLGGSYQKFFGMDAQKAAMTSGRQLLGLMTDINRGMTANLMLSNVQIASLMDKMVQASDGADVSKTLIPFIGTAQEQLKGLGIQSAYVRDKLNESMLSIKATGAGLPKSMAMFMLGGGKFFNQNRMSGEEQQIASAPGEFAYEKAKKMATKAQGPAQKFWSSDKLMMKGYADLALKLKAGNIPGLLATQSDDQISNITKGIYELYQIEGAEEALGVSLASITNEFAKIAKEKPVLFKAMGGDMDSLTSIDQFAKAQQMVKTGKKADGSMATPEEMAKAAESMKSYANQMTPQDRANQFLEKIVGSIDSILAFLLDIPGFGDSDKLDAQRGGLNEGEYNRMLLLQQNINRDETQTKQLQELQRKQYEVTNSISKAQATNSTGDIVKHTEIQKDAGKSFMDSIVAAMNNQQKPG